MNYEPRKVSDLDLLDEEQARVVYTQPIIYVNLPQGCYACNVFYKPTPEEEARAKSRSELLRSNKEWRSMLPLGDWPYGP